jgi:type I restriction enzyme S subunit
MSRELPEGWKWKRLKDIIAQRKGTKPDLIDTNLGDPLVYLTADYLRTRSADYYVPRDKIRKCVLSDSANLLLIWDGSNSGQVFKGANGVVASTMVKINITDPDVDPDFLYYYLLNGFSLLNAKTVGGSIPHVSAAIWKAMRIPVPPRAVQQRIVSILSASEDLKDSSEQSVELIDWFYRNLYISTFYGSNPDFMSWEPMTFRDLALEKKSSFRTGPFGSQLRHSEFISDGVAVLGIDNVVENRFRWAQRRYISLEKYEKLKRYRVFPGDVLITIMGTVGRSCIVPADIPMSISTKHLVSITCDTSRFDPLFLSHTVIFHPDIRNQLERAGRGAIMDGLNMGIIKSLSFRAPPLDLQKQYSKKVQTIERAREANLRVRDESDTLLKALFSEYFAGRYGS